MTVTFLLIAFPILLFLHFLADFVAQPDEMARRKSESFKVLLHHCSIHLVIFYAGCFFLFGPLKAFVLAGVNASLHGFIDWNIWRGFKKWAARNNLTYEQIMKDESARHKFFVTIGADQLLHGISIVIAVIATRGV